MFYGFVLPVLPFLPTVKININHKITEWDIAHHYGHILRDSNALIMKQQELQGMKKRCVLDVPGWVKIEILTHSLLYDVSLQNHQVPLKSNRRTER
jgi:hypothetical protein